MRNLYYCCFIACFFFCISGCKKSSPYQADFMQLEQMVWTAPDSAKLLLEQLHADSMTRNEQMICAMLHEFCQFRLQMSLSPDSVMQPIVEYFERTKNYHYLGKALYIQGAEYEWLQNFEKGTECLKQAESYLNKYERDQRYIGMNYYKLGRCAEMELLYHIAHQYYQQALPYFIAENNIHYMAYCYRDLARTIPDRFNHLEEMNHYYDSAMICAQETNNKLLYYEIKSCYLNWQPVVDSTELIATGHILCDSLGAINLNAVLIRHYLNKHDFDKAQYYLDGLAADTTRNLTNDYIYYSLQSEMFHARHNDTKAYEVLRRLYDERHMHTEFSGDAKTIAIAKCYDVERERANTLQVANSRLRIIIISLFVLFFLAAVAAWAFYKAKQNQILLQKSMAEAQLTKVKLDAIRQQTADKDMFLRNLLMQRLHNTDMLKYQLDIHKAPQWAMPILQKMLLTNKENRTLFLQEYNHLFAGFLSYIQKQFPSLTQEDILCLALFSLNLDSLQVATLIGYQKQSIWNRRNSIKTHLAESNGPVVDDLSAWITELRDEYLAQVNPQPVDAEQSASSEEDTTDITDSQTDTSV